MMAAREKIKGCVFFGTRTEACLSELSPGACHIFGIKLKSYLRNQQIWKHEPQCTRTENHLSLDRVQKRTSGKDNFVLSHLVFCSSSLKFIMGYRKGEVWQVLHSVWCTWEILVLQRILLTFTSQMTQVVSSSPRLLLPVLPSNPCIQTGISHCPAAEKVHSTLCTSLFLEEAGGLCFQSCQSSSFHQHKICGKKSPQM